MALVRPAEQVEFAPRTLLGTLRSRIQVQDRRTRGPQQRPLVRSGKVTALPHGRAVDRATAPVVQDHVARQVLVLAPQAVSDPRPDGWIACENRAGCHVQCGCRMQRRIDFDAVGECQLISDAAEIAKHGRHLTARPAVPPELERAAHCDDIGPDIRIQLRRQTR